MLNPTERPYVSLKNSTNDLENGLPLKKSNFLYVAVTEDFEHF